MSTRSVFVDDSSYACLHLHKRIVLTMSNKTAVKCSDVRYNFAKSICMHSLRDMCKDIRKISLNKGERENEKEAIKFLMHSDEM